MVKLIRQNSVFLVLCSIFLICLATVLLVYPKAELHLMLNAYHSPFLDTVMSGYTVVAEYIPYIIVAIIILFYKAGWGIYTLSGILLSGLLTQILKHIINAPRPLSYFAANYPDIQLQLVEGVHMSQHFSCPSGHTTTFFALFFCLSALCCHQLSTLGNESSDNIRFRWIGVIIQAVCFLCAVVGAYSRIYLSQHFAFDIFAGTIIGLVTAVFCLKLVEIWQGKPFFEWNILKNAKK